MIFISRDPRAIATSAYHFFHPDKVPSYKVLWDAYKIKNIDDFAKIVFEGKFTYGDIQIYDKTWKEFAKTNQGIQIHFGTDLLL